MVDNSYDIPAMKFYILIPLQGFSVEHAIPFENFDGLCIKDVQASLESPNFSFVSAINYRQWDGTKCIYPIDRINFTHSNLIGKENVRIDKEIEEILERNLDKESTKRTYACFCQRYQGKEYGAIKQFLKSKK